MPNWQKAKLTKCPVDKMPSWPIAKLTKQPRTGPTSKNFFVKIKSKKKIDPSKICRLKKTSEKRFGRCRITVGNGIFQVKPFGAKAPPSFFIVRNFVYVIPCAYLIKRFTSPIKVLQNKLECLPLASSLAVVVFMRKVRSLPTSKGCSLTANIRLD